MDTKCAFYASFRYKNLVNQFSQFSTVSTHVYTLTNHASAISILAFHYYCCTLLSEKTFIKTIHTACIYKIIYFYRVISSLLFVCSFFKARNLELSNKNDAFRNKRSRNEHLLNMWSLSVFHHVPVCTFKHIWCTYIVNNYVRSVDLSAFTSPAFDLFTLLT